MWDLIVSVPDHCLSFYFPLVFIKLHCFSSVFSRLAEIFFIRKQLIFNIM